MVFSLEDTLEIVRGFPVSFLFPFAILAALSCGAHGSHEFTVFRMYQYELHGSSFGCHGSMINMEARAATAHQLHRRCVVTRLTNLSVAEVERLLYYGAGSLLILLPQNMTHPLEADQMKRWQRVEQSLLNKEISVPIYFAAEDEDLTKLYEHTVAGVHPHHKTSAFQGVLSVFTAHGYQMVVGTSDAKAMKDPVITNIVGRLQGLGDDDQLPTILFVAHYDSHGVAPDLSHGADSNGSGVAALLELARLFSKLYADERTRAKFNLVFLLSGGGKYDFQGTKRWLDDTTDADNTPLSNVHYVICLDSIGRGSHLYLHVSKPPKEGSHAFAVVSALKEAAEILSSNFSLIHKKIKVSEDRLAWEHERFSMKRYPAATVSRFPSFERAQWRNTIFDRRSKVEIPSLMRNVRLLAEGVARYIYNLSSVEHESAKKIQLFQGSLAVQDSLCESFVHHFSSMPRSAQLFGKDHPLLSLLEQTLGRYVSSVRRHLVRPDKRDPDFIFYDGTKARMVAYSIKPAIFDLVLAIVIAAYLFVLFCAVRVFPMFVNFLISLLGYKAKQL